MVYLFYPETAGRSLEDVDRFFDENKNIFVFTDPNAKSNKRPAKYEENEQEEMRRNSSVAAGDARRRTSVWQDNSLPKYRSAGSARNGDLEKGEEEKRSM